MSRFVVTATPLPGVMRIQRQPLADARGALTRLFCAQELADAGWHGPIAQINHTRTVQRGTVRGLHYQRPPSAETKLVSCLHGAVWDVVVDLRTGSPSFLHWYAEELSADNHTALLIPPGCAHGFQALQDNTELLYLHSAPHSPHCEGAVHVSEPKLAIAWPLPIANLSARDAAHAPLTSEFEGITL